MAQLFSSMFLDTLAWNCCYNNYSENGEQSGRTQDRIIMNRIINRIKTKILWLLYECLCIVSEKSGLEVKLAQLVVIGRALIKQQDKVKKGGKNLVTIDELIVLHILQLKGYKHIVKNVLIYLEQYQD